MEKQFDQAFVELLKSGSRHEQANYRNCIIEEERRRANHQDLKSIRQRYEDMTKFHKDGRDLTSVSVCLETALIIAGIVFIIVFLVKQQYISAAIMLVLAVLDCLSLRRSLAKFKYFYYSYEQFSNGKVAVIVPMTDGGDSFPEIFKVLSLDTEEILRSKKAKLDEILGL